MRYLLILLLLLVYSLVPAEVNIDSLKIELEKAAGTNRVNILNELALASNLLTYQEKIEYGLEALNAARMVNYYDGEVLALRRLALNYKRINDYEKSLQYFQLVIEKSHHKEDEKDIAWANNIIGMIYRTKGEYDKALEAYEIARKINSRISNMSAFATNLVNMSTIHNLKGNYDLSLKLNEQALQLHQELNNEKGVANTLNNMGVTYMDRGYYEIALDYFMRSLAIKEKLKNMRSVARTLHNIGIIYRNLSNYEKALEYNLKSLKIKDELGKKKGIALSFNNIGIIYNFMGNNELALDYHQRSLAIKEEFGMQNGIAVSLNNIGKIYLDMKKFDLAEQYLQRSFQIKEENDDKRGIAETLNHQGNLFSQKGKYQKAGKLLKKSEQLCLEMELRDKLQFNYLLQSELYMKKENYQKSLEYFKLYEKTKGEIFNQESSIKLAELQTIYEIEKKEQEIELLSRDHLITQMNLKQQKILRNFLLIIIGFIFLFIAVSYRKYRHQIVIMAKLRELNATKDKFFSIIAHDLRSPLIAQLSGTRLLTKFIATKDSDSIQKTAQEMHKNVQTLFSLLDNLLSWARLQQKVLKPSFIQLTLNRLVEERLKICDELIKKKELEVKVEVDDKITIYADKNMIESVLQNLLINAIKFSHKKDEIKIYARECKHEIEIRIEDQGIGISQEDIGKLFRIDSNFSKRGTNNEKGTGLGLILCKDFINMHKGKIWVESELGKGSTFLFTIPRK